MRTRSINAEITRNIMVSHKRRAATRSHWLRKLAVERQMARCQKRCEKKNSEKMPRIMTKRTAKKAQFTKEIPQLPHLIVTRRFYLTCNCQRKVEMSAFSQYRNVRFHGFLQGCWAGTWYLGLILFLGLGRSASPGGRRPEGLAEDCWGAGQ